MCRLVLRLDTVYAHVLYVSLTLACMWWGLHWVSAAGRKRLERSQNNYRTLVEQSLMGVCVYAEDTVLYANARFCRMLGWEPGSLAGVPLSAFLPATDRERFQGLVGTPGLPLEFSLSRCDGAPIWVEAACAPVEYLGRPGVQVDASDITSRKLAEENRRELAELVRRQEEQLEHSTRLAELGEMSAAISHELNQPLTGIRNYARNAFYMIEKRAGGEDDVKNNLRLISEQVDRAAKIINQMRELTRRSDSAFAPLDVNGVIRESVEFLLPQMRLSEVDVSMDLAEDLPLILGDRIRLAQVFLNLLSNARQAMDCSARRRLRVSSRRDARGPFAIAMEVADTGKGFSEEQGRRMFQSFYTTRKGGHGLGLSISRAIIQDHKGIIEAVGVPEGGATFTIRLPAASEGGAARPAESGG